MTTSANDEFLRAKTALDMNDIPPPVMAFVHAVNCADHRALTDLFAVGALVNDQLRDFWGAEAISRWLQQEVVGDRLTLGVRSVLRHFESIVLVAEVDGEFDKTGLPSPLILHFHFSVLGDRIVRLMILSHRSDDAEPEVRVPRLPR